MTFINRKYLDKSFISMPSLLNQLFEADNSQLYKPVLSGAQTPCQKKKGMDFYQTLSDLKAE